MAVIVPLSPVTWTGVTLELFVPSPNEPYRLLPTAQTVPSDFIATVNHPPAATAVAVPVNPVACTGLLLGVVVPFPNMPL